MRKAILAAVAATLLSGCLNLYTRFPTTDPKIEMCYQSTAGMARATVIASFPQMMSDSPSTSGSLCWENLLTVPFLGLPCFVDTVCEACVDTVCLPIDWCISEAREEK